MAVTDAPAEPAKKERWTAQWAELFDEVVTSGLCTGCAGCVVACPHDVLGYDDTNGVYKPFHLEAELGPADCGHGQRGCTSCTRACPRFRDWETEIDTYLFGRPRDPDEMDGVSKDIILARATNPEMHEKGQAGGFALNIGLLCSKTFDDAIFEELFEAKYGLKKQDMVKMNIKGVFQIWMKDGSYHEVNLKECHAWTREGCKTCPDFAAEHADISTGGIGAYNDWTMTIVLTDLGREIIIKMLEDGTIEGRPGDDDPGAIDLLRRLSITSRRRWPSTAIDLTPKVGVPPPKKKAAAPAPTPAPT